MAASERQADGRRRGKNSLAAARALRLDFSQELFCYFLDGCWAMAASRFHICLPPIALLVVLLAPAPATAAQYAVDGFSLGARVAPDDPNYMTFSCKPADDVYNATRCDRRQQRNIKGTTVPVTNAFIYDQDGTVIYTMMGTPAATLNNSIVHAEVESLSRQINEQPANVNWPNVQDGAPNAVFATWGSVKLEEVGGTDLADIADGKDPHLGVLVDALGDLPTSAKKGYSIYRITGGRGYLYTASFDANGRGRKRYIAVDPADLAVRQYQAALQKLLQQDQSLAKDDYRLWPDVAIITRVLAREMSPKVANDALDAIFKKFPAKKLQSHVWALIPSGAILRLGANIYSRLDQYGPQTEHPDVRNAIQSFLASKQSDPFIEFAYYINGDFEKGLSANPKSVIANVLHYAAGYKIMGSLLANTLPAISAHLPQGAEASAVDQLKNLVADSPDTEYYVASGLSFANQNRDLYRDSLLGSINPDFAAHAAAAKPHFEAVTRDSSMPLADDAAYMLGWLAHHQGKLDEAMADFSQAMIVGNGDYSGAATSEVIRIFAKYPARQQFALVESHSGFAKQPALWYLAARAAYRDFDFALAGEIANHGLNALKVPADSLPQTTDPDRIAAAIEKIDPDLAVDPNAVELPYVIQASKEISQYLDFLNSAGAQRPDILYKRARATIIKYSMLIDPSFRPGSDRLPHVLAHRDLRQALHMIDATLDKTAKDPAQGQLREWLYYRKVRIMAVYQPERTGGVVEAMQREFPNSKLLDDAMAEQIYAQGIEMGDPQAARTTFQKLLVAFPNGNAVDNAYSWMSIILRTACKTDEEQTIERDLIRRFPLTRHARYARERLAKPVRCQS